MTWLIPMRFENSVDCSAKSAPFSNCRYPTGVSVAGVDTVGRPGLASGSDVAPDCAKQFREKRLNKESKQIARSFKQFPLSDTRDSTCDISWGHTSGCMSLSPATIRTTKPRGRCASKPYIW